MTSHLGIYSPSLTTPFNTKTPTLESPEGAEMKMIQSDDYDDALIFFFSMPRLDVHHVTSSLEAFPGFEVKNRETLFYGLPGPGLSPIFYLGESKPNPPSYLNLGGGFEPKPPKPPLHVFAPCTRVGAPWWHPASSPLELPRSPSEGLHSRCRTAPPCTELPWPTDAETCLQSIGGLLPQSIEVFVILYLQSIEGPPVHQRA